MPKHNSDHHQRRRYHQIQRAYRRKINSGADDKRHLHRKTRAQCREQLHRALKAHDLDDLDIFISYEQHRDLWEYEHVFEQAYLSYERTDWRGQQLGVPMVTDQEIKRVPASIRHDWKNQRATQDYIERTPCLRQYLRFETLYEILRDLDNQKLRFLEDQVRKRERDYWRIHLRELRYNRLQGLEQLSIYHYELPAPSLLRQWMVEHYFRHYNSKWKPNSILHQVAKDLQTLGYWPWTHDTSKQLPEELR